MPKPLSTADTQKLLKSLTLPPLPAVMADFRQARENGADLAELAKIVSDDLGIAAAVLKVANSPSFASRTLDSVQDAIFVLGASNLDAVVSGVALKQAIPLPPILQSFWEETTRIAAIASQVAKLRQLAKPEQAYLFCLFRDCGIPVLAQRFPTYLNTLARAMVDSANFVAIEEKGRATSHTTVGYLLARTWFMPETLAQAILHHHDFQLLGDEAALAPESARLIALASLAEHLLFAHLRNDQGRYWKAIAPAIQAELSLNAEDIDELTETLSAG